MLGFKKKNGSPQNYVYYGRGEDKTRWTVIPGNTKLEGDNLTNQLKKLKEKLERPVEETQSKSTGLSTGAKDVRLFVERGSVPFQESEDIKALIDLLGNYTIGEGVLSRMRLQVLCFYKIADKRPNLALKGHIDTQ
ncbi:hypothetical protein BEWA_036860 [Theileria equi strain WA]|uniref:Uncharacterized protein n=1 Tax=Theileria equi strain WA TaxID=1537102 RepID=L1LEH1_THEEQ|nr:hypothetical protein BEWA_036860 [Theileria equi strain WA]EKX73650.1 hypothetical protein BEWA_036860 [Theileria equi strain WA]|eukprot:XP_004833102.1 hypothetical protein BEWA_036860 [Theileria equi strain WA]